MVNLKDFFCNTIQNTVDGSEIRRSPVEYGKYPIIYRVSYMWIMWGGCLGFPPPTIVHLFGLLSYTMTPVSTHPPTMRQQMWPDGSRNCK